MTSARVVSKVKRLLRVKKVGHAGTLDPLASGILPIAVGEATKTVSYVMSDEKAYEFEVTWGAQTETDDLEGDVILSSKKRPAKEDIEHILPDFIGQIEQTPPAYSAIKVDGKRAYAAARQGQEVMLPPRIVHVKDLRILAHDENLRTKFYVECGKGTYVRSIARDLGQRLGCYGHVSVLRRVRVGEFGEKCAISLEKLEKLVHNKGNCVLSIPLVLDDIPAVGVTDEQEEALRQGRMLFEFHNDATIRKGTVLCVNHEKPIALAELAVDGLRPFKVFNI